MTRSIGVPVDVHRDDGAGRPCASRAAARASLPACPRRARSTVPVGRRQVATFARRRRKRRRSRARSPAAGRPAPRPRRPDRTRRQCPRPRSAGDAGSTCVDRLQAQRRQGQGGERHDRVAERRRRLEVRADGGHRSEEDAARVGLRVVHLAPGLDDLEDPLRPSDPGRPRRRRGCCGTRSNRGTGARPRPRTRTAHRAGGVEARRPAAAARPGGRRPCPAPSSLPCHRGLLHLHERSLGTYAASHPLSRARVR